MRAVSLRGLAFGAALAGLGWWAFLLFGSRHYLRDGLLSAPVLSVPVEAVLIGAILAWAIAKLFLEKKERPAVVLLTLLVFIWAFVGAFAVLYYAGGGKTDANFICGQSVCQLSRWGAMYFTIGTLTSGTGNLLAVHDGRAIQGTQMVLDVAVILFAVTAIVSRFVTPQPAEQLSDAVEPPDATPEA